MRLFFAGAQSFPKEIAEANVKNVLNSFFDLKDNKDIEGFLKKKYPTVKDIFLDSGGFVARMHGKSISIEDYGQFLLKYKHLFFTYANLDLTETKDTLANQQYLESMGLRPMPVYHMNEYMEGNRELLDQYIKDYDYIALGGYAKVNAKREDFFKFLNYCFSKTRDKTRVHGFGMTATKLLERYPFFSVDSTSWQSSSRYGMFTRFEAGRNITIKKSGNAGMENFLHYRRSVLRQIQDSVKIEEYYTNLWKTRGVCW